MSLIQEKLCHKILKEYFGNIIAQVGEVLMKKGCNTLRYLIMKTNLPKLKVQEALCALIKHNIVVWDENKTDNAVYILLHDRVLLLLRFPRYVFLIREKYGEEAEMVADVLLKEGQATASQIIIYSALKLLDAVEEGSNLKPEVNEHHIKVRNALEKLIKSQYIQRCPSPENPIQRVPSLKIQEQDLYRFDSSILDLKLLQNEIRERRVNPDPNLVIQASKTILDHPDKEIFWRLNYDTFHLEMRDNEMLKCISQRVDTLGGKCFGSILKAAYKGRDPWNSEFHSILATEIRDHQCDIPHLDQYLKLIGESGGNFFRKVGDAGGGEYVLNLASLTKTITLSHIDDVVRERFGSKAARIFRLVRQTGMMEQDQIAEQSMISKKEANVLTHRLLNDGFLRLYEARKGIAPTPASKSTYLFYVDISMLVRMMLEWTFKAAYNLLEQRDMRQDQNKRLLERKARVEMIVENLRQSGGTEEQIQEVEEIFSPAERENVKKIIETQEKLLDFETGLDETIFMFQMFLYYETHK